jgi:hypothetical protein
MASATRTRRSINEMGTKEEAGEADSVEAKLYRMAVGDEVAEAGEVEGELQDQGQTVLS